MEDLFELEAPSETVDEASRRVEHAGNTPPSTPAPDAELVVDGTADDISHEDIHDLDASYLSVVNSARSTADGAASCTA